MTITVDITAEVSEKLNRQAATQGLALGAYAAALLEEATGSASKSTKSDAPRDMVELFAPLRGLNIEFERDRDPGRDLTL